jgi:hypothetical protein
VGLAPFDVDHKADTTGFVLKPRVIKALFDRRAGSRHKAALGAAVSSNRHFEEIRISASDLSKFR